MSIDIGIACGDPGLKSAYFAPPPALTAGLPGGLPAGGPTPNRFAFTPGEPPGNPAPDRSLS
eukprot:892148-Pyramimonas_sp.AAC.1